MIGYRRSLFTRTFSGVIFILMIGCGPFAAGVDLYVHDKDFSNAILFVDGKRKEKLIYNNAYFVLSPGEHSLIVLSEKRENLLELNVIVNAGEKYVSYYVKEGKLYWNWKEYEVIPGKPVFINELEDKKP